jgi:hypothetical protein
MSKLRLLVSSGLVALALGSAAGPAAAKLPAPPETAESKANAEETLAKAAAAAKREAEELARYQDKAAANYKERQGR